MKKRALALLLTVVMVFSCLPLTVFAAEEDEEIAVAEEASVIEAAPVEEEILVEEILVEEAAMAEEGIPDEIDSPDEGEGLPVMIPNILTEANFPDARLLAFLLNRYDGYLNEFFAAEETSLDISGQGIADLNGLAYWFPNLEYLNCSNNSLSALDVSGFSMLRELMCYGNQLTSLKLTGLTQLSYLDCSNNRLCSLELPEYELESFYGYGQRIDSCNIPAVVLGGSYIVKLDEVELPSGAWLFDYSYYNLFDCDGNATDYACFYDRFADIEISLDDNGYYYLYATAELTVVGQPEYYGPDYYLMQVDDYTDEDSLPISKRNSYPDWVDVKVSYRNDTYDLWEKAEDFVEAGTDYYGQVYLEAVKPGSGEVTIIWGIPDVHEPRTIASFRVDVFDDENPITGVSLTETKKTIELYRDTYESFGILLEMDQLIEALGTTQYVNTGAPIDCGWTLDSVEFADKSLRELFSLVPDGDRTVQIVPTSTAIQEGLSGKLKSNYSGALKVTLSFNNGEYGYTTAPLTINVKKSMPSLKAGKVSLNSYLGVAETAVLPTGAVLVPEGICDVVSGTAEGVSVSINEYGALCVAYSGAPKAKKSATLKLECQVEGWRVTAPLSLKVSVAPVTPGLKFAKSSVTVTAGMPGDIYLNYKLTAAMEAAFPGEVPEIIDWFVIKGNASPELSLWTNSDLKTIGINAKNMEPGASGTFLVTLRYVDKEFSFKVIVKPYSEPKLSYTVSGAIDYATISSTGCSTPIAIKPTLSGVTKINGYYPGYFDAHVECEVIYNGEVIDGGDASHHFTLSQPDSSGKLYLWIYTESEDSLPAIVEDYSESGCTFRYTLTLRYCPENSGEDAPEEQYYVEGPAKEIKLKRSEKLAPSVSIKASGSLDPLHIYAETSEVTLTVSYKNLPYGWAMENQELVFYKKVNGKWEELSEEDVNPFLQSEWYNSGEPESVIYDGNLPRLYDIRLEDPYLEYSYGVALRVYPPKDGYDDEEDFTDDEVDEEEGTFSVKDSESDESNNGKRIPLCESAISPLKVKAGKVKLVTDKTSVTLLLKDRFDRSDTITVWDKNPGFSGIAWIEFDDSFEGFILYGDYEEFAIQWANNTLPTGWKNGTTRTITMKIYAAGNMTLYTAKPKPDAILKIKVTGISQPAVTDFDVY